MKARGLFLTVILGISLFLAPLARAEQDGKQLLKEFFQKEVNRISSDQCSLEAEEDWPLKRIFVTVEPYVTLGLGNVLSLTVAPEIAFVWEKVDHVD